MEANYFKIAVFEYLLRTFGADAAAFTADEIIDFVEQKYFSDQAFSKSVGLVQVALTQLSEEQVLHHMPDPYAGEFYARAIGPDGLMVKYRESCPPFLTYERMGTNGSIWLQRALTNIEAQLETEVKFIGPSPTAPIDEDSWEPLPLEIARPEVQAAVAELENIVGSIRADNGFAAELPVERDNLIAHAEATIQAAKEGKVSKGQVRQNIVAAGRWLAEKFGGTAIGALGAELAKWGLKILGWLPW